MNKLAEFSEKSVALFLIERHSGVIRDEADLNKAKYHAHQTLEFAENMLNFEGTVEEKLQYISKIKDELPKFKVK